MTSMRSRKHLVLAAALAAPALLLAAGEVSGPAAHRRKGDDCTTVAAGRLATADGSVMTSEACDGHDGRTWVDVRPHRSHRAGETTEIRAKTDLQFAPDDLRPTQVLGSIPQVAETYGYVNTIYPAVNEHQLAIGESTFGGKEVMASEKGLINCYELTRLMAERCRTAREAIALAGQLLAKYGWNDEGETLTIADTREVWLMEIVGPGKDRVGAVWVARRVPDGHVTVAANASRIRELECKDAENWACSDNVVSRAVELGLYDPKAGHPFEFCYAYAERGNFGSSRREWRALSLLAPSLKLNANAENFPFSVKPDRKIGPADLMAVFRDTYEDTPYDLRRFMKVTDKDGKSVLSPYASPFLYYDQMELYHVWGGWGENGERPIARWYCITTWISQSRGWLPDPVGGVAWLGWQNPATTTWVPLYAGMLDAPASFKVGGDRFGGGRPAFTPKSAWWSFNRVAKLSAQRWGDIRQDVYAVRDPLQAEGLALQAQLDAEISKRLEAGDKGALAALTERVDAYAAKVVAAYWQLGDDIWTRYDEKF
ncbi:MAG TPA: C69 family dipeptidase [Thermoanaerobaculaceae bacterium]|nr:C69 family dipeptidase [Thermoanaerobaculaceae bacterium]